MSETTIGRLLLVGGGFIGEALLSGFLSSGVLEAEQLCVVEPSEERRAFLQNTYAVELVASTDGQVLTERDVCLLAVKPGLIPLVARGLAAEQATGLATGQATDQTADQTMDQTAGLGGALLISIAAGVTLEDLQAALPAHTAVVRVMPNLPVVVGAGMAQISRGKSVTDEQMRSAVKLFESVGRATVIDEELQNVCAAIAGCGPAYFALVVDALAQAGVSQGISPELAQELAAQTALGTAQMLLDPDQHPDQLIDAVSSPGGMTIAALAELESHQVREAFDDAARAAVRRAVELKSAADEEEN